MASKTQIWRVSGEIHSGEKRQSVASKWRDNKRIKLMNNIRHQSDI